MIGALVILAATVVIGIVLYLFDKHYYKGKHDAEKEADRQSAPEATLKGGVSVAVDDEGVTISSNDEGEECCGMHKVCEKTNLSPVTTDYEYYDDEELDRFRGREPESYNEEESEEFREILMSLLPSDVAGWSRSLQVREIKLPLDVREELLMIVSDLRHSS